MDYELPLRLGTFIGLFAVFALAERLVPRRRAAPRGARWLTNWSLVLLDSLTLRAMALLLPLLAVGAAVDARALGWGLFNHLGWAPLVEGLLAVLILDALIWAQHLVTHKVPLLWRIHRVHHADLEVDVTTAIRFHPVEIALSMLIKIGAVYALGAAPLAVVLFEVILNGTALFNHANIRLGPAAERWLRLFIVTPDMHRIHHSVHRDEHDSNYGFALSIWDRLLGTYRAEPRDGHETMATGLQWRDDRPARLGWSLALPFRRG